MNFTEAWNKRLVDDTAAGDKSVTQARINFDSGNATMVIPNYYRNEGQAMETLSRAWKTYCKGKGNAAETINSIIIEEIDPRYGNIPVKDSSKLSA